MRSIVSPGRSGMSRYAPLKSPEKAKRIFSSTSSELSGATVTVMSARGRT
jgi:hypothetical protein